MAYRAQDRRLCVGAVLGWRARVGPKVDDFASAATRGAERKQTGMLRVSLVASLVELAAASGSSSPWSSLPSRTADSA